MADTVVAFRFAAGLPDTVVIDITADDAESDSVTATSKSAILDPGLFASYSTGPTMLEGPVFNGWSAGCGGTGNNMYQGECQAAVDGPVDWAWGGFAVEWDGYLFTNAGGDIYFSSYYWVDGVVYIEVNGEVVADLDTSGGGYGATIALPAATWVPVHMTFSGNGGSNNMHLGWPAIGGIGWEAVPRGFLATPRSVWTSALRGD